MSNSLAHIISQHITMHGPMTVEAFWNLCLAHPVHGYYIKQDPLGRSGDFVTAPEISQLFGEMIGIWIVEKWQSLGASPRIHLVECGPGRGTLMADIMRIIKYAPALLEALTIHLVEISPHLRTIQRERLSEYTIQWHDDLSTLPDDGPCIIIGNEFLDALPIRQYICIDNIWHERVIGLGEDGLLEWGLIKSLMVPCGQAIQEKIVEISLPRERVMDDILLRLNQQGGACLMIDYGHDEPGCGDTFQAVQQHQFVDVLTQCGDADLTSHVDFSVLRDQAEQKGFTVKLGSQQDFLRRHGIELRAMQLMKKATDIQKESIQTDLTRLLSPTEMGQLFRVMEIS